MNKYRSAINVNQTNPAQSLDHASFASADQSLQELVQYRRRRFIASRRPLRLQEEFVYRARVREWLRQPENRWCRVYSVLCDRRVPATQCHHYQGRRGMLLLYEPFWIPVSWDGHLWIDDHRERARELDLLCPLGRFNSPVPTARD